MLRKTSSKLLLHTTLFSCELPGTANSSDVCYCVPLSPGILTAVDRTHQLIQFITFMIIFKIYDYIYYTISLKWL